MFEVAYLLIPILLLAFNLLLTLAFSLLVFKRGAKDLVPAFVSIAIIAIAGIVLQYPAYPIILAAALAVVFTELALQYSYSLRGFALIFLVAMLEALLLELYYGATIIYLFAIGFSLGTASGLEYFERLSKRQNKRSTNKVEVSRDVFQVALGIVLLAAVFFFKYTGAEVIAFFGILAYILVSIVNAYSLRHKSSAKPRKYGLFEALLSFERHGTIFGIGALYLLSGYLLIFGTVHEFGFLLFGIAVLTISDSFATIVGRSLKRRHALPYNRSKSVEGSMAFFLVSLAFGLVLLSNPLFAILSSALLAFLESIHAPLDDNVITASAIVLLYALFLLI